MNFGKYPCVDGLYAVTRSLLLLVFNRCMSAVKYSHNNSRSNITQECWRVFHFIYCLFQFTQKRNRVAWWNVLSDNFSVSLHICTAFYFFGWLLALMLIITMSLCKFNSNNLIFIFLKYISKIKFTTKLCGSYNKYTQNKY